ncbi:aminotransferase class IV [Chitinophaga lutea]
MSARYSIVNGVFTDATEASILISDLSIQRGYGIFDYFRAEGDSPYFLQDHLDRFYNSAAFMRLSPPLGREALAAQIRELLKKNAMPSSGVRVTLTGGYSENGYNIAAPNLLITQSSFQLNANAFEQGIRLVTWNYQRQLPQVKTIDYLQAIYLQPYVQENKADDILYHNAGELCECPRANFFVVNDRDEVLTPARNILAGVTRKHILTFTDLKTGEAQLRLEDLGNIREAFITSSTKDVLPVLQIDGKPVGDGKPGPVTRAVHHRLLEARAASLNK